MGSTEKQKAAVRLASSGGFRCFIVTNFRQSRMRRARDSNPQPLTGYLSSNEAAHQFAYPPGGIRLLRGYERKRVPCIAGRSLDIAETCGFGWAKNSNQFGSVQAGDISLACTFIYFALAALWYRRKAN